MKELSILKNTLGNYYSPKKGEYYFHCPFCKHHKKKLAVNLNKGFHCWVCDTSGKNVYYLLKRFGSFDNQQEWLKITNQIDVRDFELIITGSTVQEKIKQKIDLPKEYKPLFTGSIDLYSQKPLNYLKSRGFSQEKILEWKVGYCPSGEYKGRVIIPSFDDEGDVSYFVSRTYEKDWKKYKNPKASKDIVFNDLLIDWEKPIILVEGVFDAIHEKNMIPILGSTLSERSDLFQKIVEKAKKVFIALDPDAYKKELDIISSLIKYGVDVWKIEVPEGKDLNDISKYEYQRLKMTAVEVRFDTLFSMINI